MLACRSPFVLTYLRYALAFLLLAALCACSNRPAVAARATVQTFYSAIQVDNFPVVEDNLAPNASSEFRQHIQTAAEAAQTSGTAERAVQIVRIDTPSIRGDNAQVHVVFADGSTDVVSLSRHQFRWKVVTSSRLGSGTGARSAPLIPLADFPGDRAGTIAA